MPIYLYKCYTCGEEFEQLAKTPEIGEEKLAAECGKDCAFKRQLTTANFGDSVRMGMIKPPSEFRERVERIKKANPGHRIKS